MRHIGAARCGHVALVGGSHGNERNGVAILRHYRAKPDHLHTTRDPEICVEVGKELVSGIFGQAAEQLSYS